MGKKKDKRIERICKVLMTLTGVMNLIAPETTQAVYEAYGLKDKEDLTWILKQADTEAAELYEELCHEFKS